MDGFTQTDQLNVLGEPLQTCCTSPMTGFYRTGCCEVGGDDTGVHAVCAVMTDEFLEFSKSAGNDLSTPMPQYGFPGLRPGDAWCVCAARWLEAYDDGMAPPVRLEACDASTLEVIPLELLQQHAA